MVHAKLLLCTSLLVGFTSAGLLSGYQPQQNLDFDPNPQYSYSYSVNDASTGDSKSAEESRNGDSVTGSYTVAEADGTIRTVRYTADAVHGFNAVVEYSGVKNAVRPVVPKPVYLPAPVPAYQPAPTYLPAQNIYQKPSYTQSRPFAQNRPVYAPVQLSYNQGRPTQSYSNAGSGVHTSFSAPHANYNY